MLPPTQRTLFQSKMSKTGSHWEHFEHEADMGVRGIGSSKAEAFAQAAIALSAIITDPALIEPKESIDITCEEPDEELLLVDWLNALIFEIATRKMLFRRFEVHIEGPCLRARVWGEPIHLSRHRPVVEIKGATYTELSVHRNDRGTWVAQCVVDV